MKVRTIGNIHPPKRRGDVGYDLPVQVRGNRQTWYDKLFSLFLGCAVYVVMPHSMRSIASGVNLAMPDHVWCQLHARSSCRDARLLVAGGGIIDTGYRGELFAVLYNFGWIPRILRGGERYVQVIFYDATVPALLAVPHFTDATERGIAGFGSSGR